MCCAYLGEEIFKADELKIVSCVSVLAVTQHIEAAVNANNIHLDNQSRFCCQDLIFFKMELKIQADLSIAHRRACCRIFLKVGSIG